MGDVLQSSSNQRPLRWRWSMLDVPYVPGMVEHVPNRAERGDADGQSAIATFHGVLLAETFL